MQSYSCDILHHSKRRRTAQGQVRNESWGKVFWGPEEQAINSDGSVWKSALGLLADAAVLVSRQEHQEGESGTGQDLPFHDRRKGSKRGRYRENPLEGPGLVRPDKGKAEPGHSRLEDTKSGLTLNRGQHGVGNTMGMSPHNAQDEDNFTPIPTPLPGLGPRMANGQLNFLKQESIPLSRLSKLSGPDFKRCASHVHIAKYIEHQTNRRMLLPPAQARALTQNYAQQNGDIDRDMAGKMLSSNGTFMKSSAPIMPETTANLLPQDGNSLAMANAYLNQQQFPAPMHGHPSLAQIPPAYAHLLASQQQPPPFPFLQQQGLQFGLSSAQLQALAGPSAGALPPAALNPQLFAANYPNLTGALLTNQGPSVGPGPNGSSALPPLSIPPKQGQGPGNIDARSGSLPMGPGNGLLPADESAAASAYNMTLPNGSFNPQDLDKLRTAFNANYMDTRNPAALSSQAMLEGLRRNGMHDPSQLEQWTLTQSNGKV